MYITTSCNVCHNIPVFIIPLNKAVVAVTFFVLFSLKCYIKGQMKNYVRDQS